MKPQKCHLLKYEVVTVAMLCLVDSLKCSLQTVHSVHFNERPAMETDAGEPVLWDNTF